MSWPGIDLIERMQPKTGDVRVFWGREHKWTGTKWEPTDGKAKAAEPEAKPKVKPVEPESPAPVAKGGEKPEPAKVSPIKDADDPLQSATILEKYKLRFSGPGHKELAKAVERGIEKSADLCKITPPVCRGNLGLPRDQMPQFPDDKVRDSFLQKMKSNGVRVTEGTMKVGQLRASQKEIQAKKAIAMAGSYLGGGVPGTTSGYPSIKNAIVISKDGYIVDGHHRWAALLSVNPAETMNVIRVGVPIKALLGMVNEHPGVEKRSLAAASIGREKQEWIERLDCVLAEADRFYGLLERLSGQDERALRKGDEVDVLTHRSVAVRYGRGWDVHAIEAFDGPKEITAEYVRYDMIPAEWAAAPKGGERPSMLSKFRPKLTGSALRVKYRGEDILVPLEDVQARRGARRQRLVASAERPRGPFDAMFEIIGPGARIGSGRLGSQPVNTHGVGVSPSAAPADPHGAGRYQSYVDGPVIRKSKPGYKPVRAGAGSVVPARAGGS